jgi:hypothetical protein
MPTTADPLSSLGLLYAVRTHLNWSRWWAKQLDYSLGRRDVANDLVAAQATITRASQAENMPGASLAYLTGLVKGKWVGE